MNITYTTITNILKNKHNIIIIKDDNKNLFKLFNIVSNIYNTDTNNIITLLMYIEYIYINKLSNSQRKIFIDVISENILPNYIKIDIKKFIINNKSNSDFENIYFNIINLHNSFEKLTK